MIGSGVRSLLLNDAETQILLVGYGFAAIVAKSVGHTAVSHLSEVSQASPVEIFELFLASGLSESELDAVASISFPYTVIQQALVRLLDPIWDYPVFTLSKSLTLSSSMIERLLSICRQFRRFYESHFDLKPDDPTGSNLQVWSDFWLVCQLQDIFGLCLHVPLACSAHR